MMFKKNYLIIFFLFLSSLSYGGKIERAFEALKIYDYFKAKQLFEEVLDKEKVAASYGLSIIHSRNDNPFYDLNIAFEFAKRAEFEFATAKESYKKQLLDLNIDFKAILEQKYFVQNGFWQMVKKSKDFESINEFLLVHKDFRDANAVVKYRNDLAFEIADSIASMESYRNFASNYPNDERAEYASDKYQKMLYVEKTDSSSIQSYVDFMHVYPDNKYVYLAENRIYEMATRSKKLESYEWMIRHFPNNPNIEEAWENIFSLSFTDFSDEEVAKFKSKYPQFPFGNKLEEALRLKAMAYYKLKKNSKWGFIDRQGIERINSVYSFVNDFSNELALVANEEHIAYIDKKGNLIIGFDYDYGYDFSEGVAVVEKGDSLGLINKMGSVIINFNYSDISKAQNSRLLLRELESGMFIYANTSGEFLFDGEKFKDATVFRNNRAIVAKGNNYGMIDQEGKYVLPLKYKKLQWDSDSTVIAQSHKNTYGVIDFVKRDTVIEFIYEYILKQSEGMYPVFSAGKYGYRSLKGTNIKPVFSRFAQDTLSVSFVGNYAITRDRNKFGVIDKQGKKVFPNIFDQIGEVKGFPVPCAKRGSWGYINEEVTLWENYIYSYAGPFVKGKAIVAKDGKYGIIDLNKNKVLDFKYDYLSAFHGDLYLAGANGKFGLIKIDGSVVIPFEYTKISKYKDDLILLELESSYRYFDYHKKEMIHIQGRINPDIYIEEY